MADSEGEAAVAVDRDEDMAEEEAAHLAEDHRAHLAEGHRDNKETETGTGIRGAASAR